jgi:hypothetical protein
MPLAVALGEAAGRGLAGGGARRVGASNGECSVADIAAATRVPSMPPGSDVSPDASASSIGRHGGGAGTGLVADVGDRGVGAGAVGSRTNAAESPCAVLDVRSPLVC